MIDAALNASRSAFAIVLSTLAIVASGLILKSSDQQIAEIGGVDQTIQVNQFHCDDTDLDVQQSFQTQSASGTIKTVYLTCSTPITPSQLSYYAVTFEDGRLLGAGATTTTNTARYVSSNFTSPSETETSSSSDRTLLGENHSIGNCPLGSGGSCTRVGYFQSPGIAIELRKTDGTAASQADLVVASCVAPGMTPSPDPANNLVSVNDNDGAEYENQPCLNSVDQNRYRDLLSNEDALNSSYAAFVQDFTSFSDTSSTLLANESSTQKTLLLYQKQVEDQIQRLGSIQDMEESTQTGITNAFHQSLDNNTASIRAQEVLLENSTSLLNQFAQITKNNLDLITVATLNNTAKSFKANAGLSDEIRSTRSFLLTQTRAAQQDMTRLLTSLQNMALNSELLETITSAYHQALAEPEFQFGPTGLPLNLFLEDPGQTPVSNELNLGPDLSTVAFAIERMRGVYTDAASGVNYGISARINLRCSALFSISPMMPNGPTGREILALLGLPGCDSTYTFDSSLNTTTQTLSTRCLCFATVQETRCPLFSGREEAWQNNDFSNTSDETIADAPFCKVPATPFSGGYNSSLALTSFDEWGGFLIATSARGSPFVGGAYRMIDLLTLTVSTVNYELLTSIVDYTNNIVGEKADDPEFATFGISFWFYTTWSLSWSQAYNNLDFYRAQIRGTIGNYMTQVPSLYNRTAAGETGRGWTFYAMLYSASMLTVSRLHATDTISQVTYSIGSDGPLQTVNAVLNNPDVEALLSPIDVIVWDPARFSSSLWDIPSDMKKLSPYAPARAHTPFYAMFGDPSQATRDQWQSIEGLEFDHTVGYNLASGYVELLDSNPASPTSGMCLGPITARQGTDCLMREAFEVSIIGTVWNDSSIVNTMTFHHRHATLDYELTLPIGVLSQDVISRCPTVASYASSNNVLYVVLVNTDTQPNFFVVQEAGSCVVHEERTLQPGESFVYAAKPCLEAPPSSPDILQFYYYDAGASTYVICPQTLTLNYTSETGVAFVGAAEQGYVVAIAQKRVDTILLALRQLEQGIYSSILTRAQGEMEEELSLGFKVSDPGLASYTGLISQIQALQAQAAASSSVLRNNVVADVTAAFIDVQGRMAEEQAAFEQGQVQLQQTLSQIDGSINVDAADGDALAVFASKDQTDGARVAQFLGALCVDIPFLLEGAIHKEGTEIDGYFGPDTSKQDMLDSFNGLGKALINTGDDGVNLAVDVTKAPFDLFKDFLSGSPSLRAILILGVILIGGSIAIASLWMAVQWIRGARTQIFKGDVPRIKELRAQLEAAKEEVKRLRAQHGLPN